MKTYFTFVLVLLVSIAFGQTKQVNKNVTTNVSPSLFDENETNKITVYSLKSLGKTAWEDHLNSEKINLSPKKYSWNSDISKIQNVKNMALGKYLQNLCGRDLPIDIHSEVINNLYFKSISYP